MFKKITAIAFIILSSFAANAGNLRLVQEPKLVYPLIAMTGAFTFSQDNKDYWCAADQVGLKCWGWLIWDVPSWKGITQLVSGKSHMCALMGNEIRCISSANEYGELDVPKITDPDRIYAGEFHNCVITKLKNVICWGKNNYGQATPPANLEGIESISASRNHSCALSDTGEITCWGDNSFQQLEIPENLGIAQELVSYYNKTEFVREHFWSDGTCAFDLFAGKAQREVCWGKNYYGPQLRLEAPKVTDLKQRQGNSSYSCGLYEDTLLCNGSLPLANLPELHNVKSFSTGRYTACAVKNDSNLVCWGHTDRMQRVPHMLNVKEIQTSPAGDYHCASHNNGLSCWGSNILFRDGRNFLERHHLTEQPPIEHLESFALSDINACVIDNQNLKCWGDNKMNMPPTLNNMKLVTAGAGFFCSLDFANHAQCWTQKNLMVKPIPKLIGTVRSFELPNRYGSNICVNYENNEKTCWRVY